jgi:RND family efflux transporter MFP subunit
MPALWGCLSLLVGCAERNEFKPPPPPAVTVARPVTEAVTDWIEFTGTTKAQSTVELRARVRGYLKQIAFADGASVHRGDLLLVIEKSPFEAELEAAQANLAKAQAATQLAEANLERTTQLLAQNATSRQQLDVDRAQLATAQGNERVARANITQAELNLSYTEIRAPISGRIGRHLVDEGNLILPDQTLLAVIESIDPIQVYFHLSERDLLRFIEMRRSSPGSDSPGGSELFLALANETEFTRRGVVDFRGLGVDSGTGTVLRRAAFANPNLELVPGMFVRLRQAVGAPEAKLLVEERALGADQRGDYVLVVNDKNVVEHRPVKLGIQSPGKRAIESGLKADEWIVVNGLQRARPGAQVTPERQPLATTAVASTGEASPGPPPLRTSSLERKESSE